MRYFLLVVAVTFAAAGVLPAAAAAAGWSAVSEPPLNSPPFDPSNVGITDSPGQDYNANSTYEVTSNPVTLPPGYSSCEIDYYRYIDLASGDGFQIAVLLNGVAMESRTLTQANNSSGQPFDTLNRSFALNSQFDPGGQVQVRLRLISDATGEGDGVHVDNIKLFCHGSPSDNGTEFMNGTSMAAPMVSGAAALLFSNDPALTASQAKDAILGSVDPLPDLDGTTVSGGRLNVYRALIGDFNPAASEGNGAASAPGDGSGGAGTAKAESGSASIDGSSTVQAKAVPGEVIVRYEAGSSLAHRAAARDDAGTRPIEGLGLPRSQLLEITYGDSVSATVRQLEANPDVAYAAPNWIRQPAAVPNDPMFNDEWGLYNNGQTVNGVTGTPGADIDAPEAWNISTGDLDTVVAVMDSGADLQHPDLIDQIWTNPDDDSHGHDFIDNDANPTDLNGHGTHVSGIALAEGNNGFGVTGVSQHASLMSLRVCGAYNSGCPDSALVQAIDYAANHGARVANGSIAGGPPDPLITDALAAHPNTLYVFAAGNGVPDANGVYHGVDNDTTVNFPCDADQVGGYTANNVICVAATNQSDQLGQFSNYGASSVDLAAPGVNILSTSSQRTFFSDDFEGGDFSSKWRNASDGGGSGVALTGSGTTVRKPNTFFKRKPGKVVRTAKPRAKVVFKFGSSQSGSTFRCKLDRAAYKPCAKKLVRRLEPGRHVLKVKAVSAGGAVDPTAAVAKFRVLQVG
jgi:subtilisin family serine protease